MSAKDAKKNVGARRVAVVLHMIEQQPFGILFKERFEAGVLESGKPLALRFYDSHGSSAEQVGHVEAALRDRVDALVLLVIDPESVRPVLLKYRDAGIPVIIVDNDIKDPSLCRTTILPNNRLFGRRLGEFFVEVCDGRGEIVEIHGIAAADPARLRSQGFREAIVGHPEMRIVGSLAGDWLYERAHEVFSRWLPVHRTVDCVFAQNDEMARAAWDVACEQGREEELLITGVDAIKGQGLSQVIQGHLAATLINPSGGRAAARALFAILEGEPVLERIMLQTSIFQSHQRIRAWREGRVRRASEPRRM